jgi:hypothetical protein
MPRPTVANEAEIYVFVGALPTSLLLIIILRVRSWSELIGI